MEFTPDTRVRVNSNEIQWRSRTVLWDDAQRGHQ